ncbi:MAG: dTDP-4-dehydrorhamnose 3,5-epimerase [Hyphomicrobiaceae bacterium]
MLFAETELSGAYLITSEPMADNRGSFMRTFCTQEFEANGLHVNYVQHSISTSVIEGTIRGMHFQMPPHDEIKVVACRKGTIHDVIIDLRAGSATQGCWRGFELSAESRRQLYIPAGFAHGFQTLTCDVEVSYLISKFYTPSAASGVRYNDRAFAIDWPLPVTSISEKDMTWPDYMVEIT